MAKSEAVLDVDSAVQASILLFAAEGGNPVAGPTKMRMMVFYLLKNVDSIAGRGLGGTDAHERCDSGDVDAELRRLSDAGAVRCGRPGIEATGAGRDAADALAQGLDERTATILANTKEFYNDLTDDEALVYTLAAYPDARGPDGSKKGEDAEDVLIGLVRKGKITTGRMAVLLRCDRADAMRMASAAGIPVFQ